MATLADYLDLRAEVVRILKTPAVVDNLDNFTRAAERYIGQNLRHRRQITTASLEFVNGRAALPADYVEMLNVFAPGGWTYVQAPLDAVERPSSAGARLALGDQSGNNLLVGDGDIATASGGFYAIDAADIVIRGASGPIRIQYFAALPTITGSLTSTNWCLAAYPELYTYCVAYEAGMMNASPETMAMIERLKDRYLQEARVDGHRGQYGSARVRVGGVVA